MADSREKAKVKEERKESGPTSTPEKQKDAGKTPDVSLRTRVYVSDAVLGLLDDPLSAGEIAAMRVRVDNVPMAIADVQAGLHSLLMEEFKKTDVGVLYAKVMNATGQTNSSGENAAKDLNLADAVIAAAAGSAITAVQDLREIVVDAIGVTVDELRSSVTDLLAMFDVTVGHLKKCYLSYVNAMSDLEDVTGRDILEREVAAYETMTRDVNSKLQTQVLPQMKSTFARVPDVIRNTFVGVLEVVLQDQQCKSLVHSGDGVEALEAANSADNDGMVLFRASPERVMVASQMHAVDELRIQLEIYTMVLLLDYFKGSAGTASTFYVSSMLNTTLDGSLRGIGMGLRKRLMAFGGLTPEEAETVVTKVERGDLEEVLKLLYDEPVDDSDAPLEIEWNGLWFSRQDPTRQDNWRSMKDGGISVWYSVDALTGRSDRETCYLLETLERNGHTYYALRPISTFGGVVSGGVQFGD